MNIGDATSFLRYASVGMDPFILASVVASFQLVLASKKVLSAAQAIQLLLLMQAQRVL